jgi:hypothetical protein
VLTCGGVSVSLVLDFSDALWTPSLIPRQF